MGVVLTHIGTYDSICRVNYFFYLLKLKLRKNVSGQGL
jgi:hypothetical protein